MKRVGEIGFREMMCGFGDHEILRVEIRCRELRELNYFILNSNNNQSLNPQSLLLNSIPNP